jgi:hypothetical protein
MRRINLLVAAAAAALPTASFAAEKAPAKAQLAPPVRVEAEGGPIDVTDIGHAAPFLGDVDDDGKRDLLVGQFGGGKLRIYKNTGTEAEPKFGKYEFMKAGADLGVVPAG